MWYIHHLKRFDEIPDSTIAEAAEAILSFYESNKSSLSKGNPFDSARLKNYQIDELEYIGKMDEIVKAWENEGFTNSYPVAFSLSAVQKDSKFEFVKLIFGEKVSLQDVVVRIHVDGDLLIPHTDNGQRVIILNFPIQNAEGSKAQFYKYTGTDVKTTFPPNELEQVFEGEYKDKTLSLFRGEIPHGVTFDLKGIPRIVLSYGISNKLSSFPEVLKFIIENR